MVRHALAAPAVAAIVLGVYLAVYHALIRLPGISGWFAGLDRSLVSTAAFFVIAVGAKEYLLRESLQRLAVRLPGERFAR